MKSPGPATHLGPALRSVHHFPVEHGKSYHTMLLMCHETMGRKEGLGDRQETLWEGKYIEDSSGPHGLGNPWSWGLPG